MSTTITPTEQNIEINVNNDVIDINVTNEIVDVNATTQQIDINVAGAYPIPNPVLSVFGRTGVVVATEGDYTLTQLGDVTLSSPSNGQVLKYNGTNWVNSTDADTGITTLNTLTALSQTFATGTSGTDFNIASATSTHTFNLPTASATNRGLLSSTDWTTFNNKQVAGNYVTLDTSQTITASKTFSVGFNLAAAGGTNQSTFFANTSNLFNGSAGSNIFGFNNNNNIYFGKGSDNGGILSWNNSALRYYALPDADGTIALVGGAGVGTVTSVAALTIGTSGTDISSTVANSTTTPVITLNVPTASATNRGALSSADWTTFNNKQNALTNPITGTGTSGQVAYFNGTSSLTSESNLFWDATNDRLGIGGTPGAFNLDVNGTARVQGNTQITGSLSIGSTTTGLNPFLQINSSSRADIVLRTGGTNDNAFSIYAVGGAFGSNYAEFGTNNGINAGSQGGAIYTDSRTGVVPPIRFAVKGTGTTAMTIAGGIQSNGNWGIGTVTDAGFRLDVNGTARVQGNLNAATTRVDGNLEIFSTGVNQRNINFYEQFGSTNIGFRFNVGTGSNRLVLEGVTTGFDFLQINSSRTDSADHILNLATTTKGFLPPRMTATQRNAIRHFGSTTLNSGLVVYDTTDNELDYYNGTAWQSLMTLGTQQTVTGVKTFSPSVTASSALARGTIFTPTLVAAANNDVLVGLDINPTFTNGAFTGVTNYAIRANGLSYFTGPNYGSFTINAASYPVLTWASNGTNFGYIGSGLITGGAPTDLNIRSTGLLQFAAGATATAALTITSKDAISSPAAITLSRNAGAMFLDSSLGNAIVYNISGTGYGGVGSANTLLTGGSSNVMALQGTNGIQFIAGGVASTNLSAQIFASTGNVLIQRGGTFTDSGFRLDVNGTTRIQSTLQVGATAIISTEQAIISSNTSQQLRLFNTGTTAGTQAQLTFTTNSANTSSAIAAILLSTGNQTLSFLTPNAGTVVEKLRIWDTGNVLIQNGGTYTDSGFRFDVNGTARIQTSLTVGTTSIITTEQAIISNNAAQQLRLYNSATVAGSQSQLTFTTNTNGAVSSGIAAISLDNSGNQTISILTPNAGTAGERLRVWNTGNVHIQNGGTFTDVASSILTINSTTKGVLISRMTSAQRTAIASPAEGLIVVQTDGTQGMYIYINATWRTLAMV